MTVKEFEAHGLHTLDSIAGLIKLAPEDQLDWRPTPNSMSLAQCIAHLADSLTEVVEWVLVPKPMPSPDELGEMMKPENLPSATPAEGLATVAAQKAKLTELLAGVDDHAWLTEQRSLPWGVAGSMAFCCGQAFEHAFGHRYQLFMYLKLLGQPVDTMVLYGMT